MQVVLYSLHTVANTCYYIVVALQVDTIKQYATQTKYICKGRENIVNNSIGSKLKTLRKGQKMTQQYVADKVGITRATLSNYEIDRRTPDLKTLRNLAECYGVGLDYFGIATADEVLELLARAKEVFSSDTVSDQRKREIHDELMKIYLQIK